MRPRSKYFLLVASMVILLFSGFIPVQASEDPDSYTDTFPLQTFDFRMYVVSLKLGDNLIVNVSSVADGDFDLFLFNTRPKEAYVSRDGYDLEIFNPEWTLQYDVTPGNSISTINFTASDPNYPEALYFLQVVLIDRGPDSYILEANYTMELYFIPFIPGYPLYIIAGVSILTFGIIFFKKRKSMIKH